MVRKRGHKKLEPFPASTFWMRFLDSVVLVVGVIGPLTTIPQILLIYTTHQATGVAATSWFGPAILDIPWILYGIAHRERAIVITYSLWLVMNTMVGVGAVLYH
jgi:uncharacterized protein with PQ loop repeat